LQSQGDQAQGGQPAAALPNQSTSQQSQSQEEAPQPSQVVRELTPEEIERQKIMLEQKVQQLREKKKKEEEEREQNREIMRRKSGKESQEALKKWEETSAEREARLAKKEKELEKKYKEDARRKVEQNKINRMKKEGKIEPEPMVVDKPAPSEPKPTSSQTESLLQIKLPDGSSAQATFRTTDSLQHVADHVSALIGTPAAQLTLSTTYPRKTFSSANFDSLLVDVGLFPRGQVIVQRL